MILSASTSPMPFRPINSSFDAVLMLTFSSLKADTAGALNAASLCPVDVTLYGSSGVFSKETQNSTAAHAIKNSANSKIVR